ncbi:putative NBS resistance protein [Trifolium pratense]|uniref:Putative NBS resistance protein n=1 Tax=Trifolium pratense TaxID=57577 RepID=A0A2K3NH97_TRIPR|nr:putative NBS resistance protein [Trifolium pratense]
MAAICPWPCMIASSPIKPQPASISHLDRSFVQALQDSCDVQISQLPEPAIKGEDLYIKITQSEYEKGLAEYKKNLHGRLVLNKGDQPITATDLRAKLSMLWKLSGPWRMTSLGHGFHDFQFSSFQDMWIAWSAGTMYLKAGVLRLSKWMNDFNPYTQRQTHPQIWIRLMELPQEYWRHRMLFEIARAIGTPLSLDEIYQNSCQSFSRHGSVTE